MHDTTPSTTRSTFITVLGWCMVGFGALGLLGNLAMASLFWFIDQHFSFEAMIESDREFDQVPMIARFIIAHMIEFALAGGVFCILVLIAATGLLKRQDWGRIATVFVLALIVVTGIALLVLELHAAITMPTEAPTELPENMRGFINTMNAIGSVMSVLKYLALFLLSGWLIKKLVSEPVRAEFA